MAIALTTILNPAEARYEGVIVTDKGKQLLSAISRNGHNYKMMEVDLAYTGSLDTSVIVSWLRETFGCEVAIVTDATGHVGSGKGQSLGDSNELEGAPDKPWHPALIWDPLKINGKAAHASLVSELNSINTCGVQNTVTATVCCCDLTEHTKEAISGITLHLNHYEDNMAYPDEPDKQAIRSVLFEPGDGPNKPRCFAGMPPPIEGKYFPSGFLQSAVKSIGSLCGIGLFSMVENQLLRGTVQATTCLEFKPIQFEVPNVRVSCDLFRRLSSPVGAAGFCEFGYAESAYGGMLLNPFVELDPLIFQGKAIQFQIKTAYAGMWLDQFQKSVPPSATFLAARSCELLTIQFKGIFDFMYVGGWFDPILMSLDGLVKSIYQGTLFIWGRSEQTVIQDNHCSL